MNHVTLAERQVMDSLYLALDGIRLAPELVTHTRAVTARMGGAI
jgi:hypothetical protein